MKILVFVCNAISREFIIDVVKEGWLVCGFKGVTLLYNIKSKAMADNNRTELVDTGARKQLVEQDIGLVKEVKMLKQHMTGMYQAWITRKALPPPPPSFLDAALTQTSDTMPDDSPYSPNPPAYPQAHDAQYYPSEVAHKVPYSYKQGPRDEPHVENERFTGRKGQDGIPRRLKGIEQSLKNKQGTGDQGSMSYKELSMSPDVRLPTGFKGPKFNLYDGCGHPVSHLRDYCNKMRSVGEKDDLLMVYFSKSLTGAALEWHNRQDIGKWPTLGDMVQDFVRYFQYRSGVTPDRFSLSKIEKKPEESFREFGLRWREKAARVNTPIGEEEMVELFLQAQGPTYFSHLIPALGKPFNDVLKMGELVEEGIKSGKIMSCSKNIQNIPVSLGGRKRNRKDDPMGFPDQHFQPRHRPRGYPYAPDDPPQCHFSPQNSQSRTSLSQYPAPQNAYLPPRAYRKPPRSVFWPSQAFRNERLQKKKTFTPLGVSYASLFQRLRNLDKLKPT
ncbi:uncharacterized protein LOC142162787 [Nicotiana tabacum]|uniref:Uncharacterized protein LOC142162787 n=1 Tax=Nicotiana tabacum TaxID=4097 RepID=A0AC58RSH7_TOBAC